MAAAYWHGALKFMATELRLAGIEPLVDPDALMPAIVLTLDEVLPEHMTLTPRHTALLGTSAITAQRWMRRRDIAAARDAVVVEPERVRDPVPSPVASTPSQPVQPEPPAAEPAPAPAVVLSSAVGEALAAVADAIELQDAIY